MANVGRVGRLAHLAVAHDVDAGGNLFSEHIVDHPRRFGFEARRIGRAAGFTRENELGQGFGPRQAASVGGENPTSRFSWGGAYHGRTCRGDSDEKRRWPKRGWAGQVRMLTSSARSVSPRPLYSKERHDACLLGDRCADTLAGKREKCEAVYQTCAHSGSNGLPDRGRVPLARRMLVHAAGPTGAYGQGRVCA